MRAGVRVRPDILGNERSNRARLRPAWEFSEWKWMLFRMFD